MAEQSDILSKRRTAAIFCNGRMRLGGHDFHPFGPTLPEFGRAEKSSAHLGTPVAALRYRRGSP
jgi:hypothetical protein